MGEHIPTHPKIIAHHSRSFQHFPLSEIICTFESPTDVTSGTMYGPKGVESITQNKDIVKNCTLSIIITAVLGCAVGHMTGSVVIV